MRPSGECTFLLQHRQVLSTHNWVGCHQLHYRKVVLMSLVKTLENPVIMATRRMSRNLLQGKIDFRYSLPDRANSYLSRFGSCCIEIRQNCPGAGISFLEGISDRIPVENVFAILLKTAKVLATGLGAK
jgi:hypothetical protein